LKGRFPRRGNCLRKKVGGGINREKEVRGTGRGFKGGREKGEDNLRGEFLENFPENWGKRGRKR